MTQLTVLIDTPENATLLKSWLKHVDFVKSVDDEPIHWSLPGRPATDDEILQMIEECDHPDGETEAEVFFDTLLQK